MKFPVLCLHGFSGSPVSVAPLVIHLRERGWQTEAPVLSGHGLSLAALAKSRWRDWYGTAETSLLRMSEASGGPVDVIGYSMGGILALKLAHEYPELVSSLVLMALPLRLPSWQERGLGFLSRNLPESILNSRLLSWPKIGGLDISNTKLVHDVPRMRAMPIGAAASLVEMSKSVLKILEEVRQPTLLMHSTNDRVVPFESSLELMRRLGSRPLEYQWLSKSRHALCQDVEKELVFEAVTKFISRHF